MASIKFTNVRKVYDKSVVAVQDFNLEVADKEFVVFVGPSGCGKSTTLRMLAGLEEITDGTIEIDGEVVNDLQPKDRNIAMVFQNYALYPHLTVFENMAFSLRIKKQAVEKVATDKDGNPKLDKNGNPVIVTTYVKMPEEEIYRRVDIAYKNKLSFVKGFDAGFRTIPAYERVNSVFVRRFYMPGSVVKVLDIELNKDTEFNADERLILDNPKATLADFYKLFEN